MKITVLMESIAVPEFPKNYVMDMADGSSALDLIEKLEEAGLTGSLSSERLLSSHALICNSEHIKKESILHDGDCLMIMKTLVGG